jgi:hypothetical protein
MSQSFPTTQHRSTMINLEEWQKCGTTACQNQKDILCIHMTLGKTCHPQEEPQPNSWVEGSNSEIGSVALCTPLRWSRWSWVSVSWETYSLQRNTDQAQQAKLRVDLTNFEKTNFESLIYSLINLNQCFNHYLIFNWNSEINWNKLKQRKRPVSSLWPVSSLLLGWFQSDIRRVVVPCSWEIVWNSLQLTYLSFSR